MSMVVPSLIFSWRLEMSSTQSMGLRLKSVRRLKFIRIKQISLCAPLACRGAGYLGVCFGSLVTANSPSSLAVGGRHNWQAILWHEYCHVVALGLTKNRIPRWLSEGISVYEELQRNGSWGQRMDRRYKQIIERDEMTPVSELSSAFSRAPNPIYMMFAYYQSALVVEFIVESYGFEALLKILLDLGNGESINQSIENHTAHIEEIDSQFKLRAKQLANSYAGKMDQAVPEPEVQKDRAKLETG